MPKYLYTFEKSEAVRWLGHLDILRTFERAIRRAGLPIAFSAGFNPRERLAFANALSTGVTGAAEPATLELTETMDPELIVSRLTAALPPGIKIHSCEEIDMVGSRDLLNSYMKAEYSVTCNCPEETSADQAEIAVRRVLEKQEIFIDRERQGRTKTVDIRSGIHRLSLSAIRPSAQRIGFDMTLALGETGNAKPTEVIGAIAEFLPDLTLRRTHRVCLLA